MKKVLDKFELYLLGQNQVFFTKDRNISTKRVKENLH